MTIKNQQIVLASRPAGKPVPENFRLIDAELPDLRDGEVLIRTLYISVDPYMRGRMSDRRSYVPPFVLDQVITGGVLGEVIESRANEFRPGDIVTGMLGWQLFSIAKPGELRKIDPALAPITTALGILGITGLTAYFGLVEIGKPAVHETVVVSGAAGAVGMTVCQLAKIKGCRVVGIAGSDEKNRYLTNELGVDATINYKTAADIRRALSEVLTNGVDVYFDNVGGEVSDAVLPFINERARIPICGQISLYNLEQPDVGPRVQPYLLIKRGLMQGFIITDFAPRFSEGIRELHTLMAQGRLKYAENIVDGFENTPRAFLGLFSGENLGKQLVKVAE